MTVRSVIFACAAAALVFLLVGCGGPGPARFAQCGNGVINGGEQCDNGSNNSDNGDCLSTCVLARCGDTFIDSQGTMTEQCDTYNLGGADCTTLGFNPGTLSCNPNCTFNTSGCPPRPTPSPTPTASPTSSPTHTQRVVSPTPTPTGPQPTATATAIVSCESVVVTVGLVYDVAAVPDLAGAVVDLNYPGAVVSLGSVTDVSGAGGISSVNDHDDQVTNVYVTTGNIPPGPFEQVVFNCAPGAAAPDASAFTCMVSDTVDPQALPVTGVGCDVVVATTLRSTPTPLPHSPTPTATAPAPPPTAPPIPTCVTFDVTVVLSYDVTFVLELAGLVLDLNYPAAVTLPGSGADASVAARITDVSGAHGVPSIEDQDTDADGVDDQLATVYVTSGNIPPGDFMQVHFDCVPGATVPGGDDFGCAVSDTVDPQGFAVEGVACSVSVSTAETRGSRVHRRR